MSLDLYQDEIRDQLAGMPPVTRPETGAFDGFIRGTGLATMRGFARAARVVDLAGSVGPIAQDALMGTGTEAQDRYFKEHDDVYGSAVQHWAPELGEVGAAADVVGGLLSTIPLVLLSPGLAAASTADIGEELVQKGVPAGKAAGVATAQAAGMALGIWMPVLGQNLWQRVFIGGAGFNALQGVTMRGASGAILEGTPAADEFKAFDGKQLTLDVLMGMAFGTLAHISPAQRAQGEVYWDRLLNWAKDLDPSQKDAVLALRQAEHMNVDSAPGKLAGPRDVEAHVQRMRQAIDQLAKGDQVAVDDLPAPKFEPDARKAAAAEKTVADLQKIAEKVRADEGIAPLPQETEAPAAKPGGTEPPPPRGSRGAEAAGAEADPLAMEAQRLAAEQPDLRLNLGTTADGQPITSTAKQFLEDTKAETTRLREQAKLVMVAAQCMLGVL